MLTILLSVFGLALLAWLLGNVNLAVRFRKQVKSLFAQSDILNQTFQKSQLDSLPDPVRRYFNLVLKEGQPYISYVRLRHNGQFKAGLDEKWTTIKGEQYFTTETPGYIWKGTTPFVTARDLYIADKGRLIVTILSLVNVVDGQGKEFDEGEFQRWLAESVWFPTNLLPSERLKWSVIDAQTAKLDFNYNELSVVFLVTFNSLGEITQMETSRFMEKGRREVWIGKMSDYKEMEGILVPTSIEAIWRLEKGDHSYAKFIVKKLEYDVSEKF